MSADAAGQAGGQAGAGSGEPTEDELRAAYEAELSRITATDMMAQTAVSLLNIGARRLAGPGDGPGADGAGFQPDLEQARDAIDGARALIEILERRIPHELGPLRDALSRLQMAYARDVQGAAGQGGPGQSEPASEAPAAGARPQPAPGEEATAGREQPGGPGPAEASGRLWVPGR